MENNIMSIQELEKIVDLRCQTIKKYEQALEDSNISLAAELTEQIKDLTITIESSLKVINIANLNEIENTSKNTDLGEDSANKILENLSKNELLTAEEILKNSMKSMDNIVENKVDNQYIDRRLTVEEAQKLNPELTEERIEKLNDIADKIQVEIKGEPPAQEQLLLDIDEYYYKIIEAKKEQQISILAQEEINNVLKFYLDTLDSPINKDVQAAIETDMKLRKEAILEAKIANELFTKKIDSYKLVFNEVKNNYEVLCNINLFFNNPLCMQHYTELKNEIREKISK